MSVGTNPFEDPDRRNAWEKGYREALLDVYVFLTANEQALDLDTNHLFLIENMVSAVNDHESGRLNAVLIG